MDDGASPSYMDPEALQKHQELQEGPPRETTVETSGAGGQARRGHCSGLSLLIQALASGPLPRVSHQETSPPPRSPTHILRHLFDLRVARRPHRPPRGAGGFGKEQGQRSARKHGCEQGQELEDV